MLVKNSCFKQLFTSLLLYEWNIIREMRLAYYTYNADIKYILCPLYLFCPELQKNVWNYKFIAEVSPLYSFVNAYCSNLADFFIPL